jgi:hypothetical protein
MFNSIFQPDTLLPAQYLETVCSTALPEAEKKLLLAVLEDAISCFRDNISTQDKRKEKLFREAAEWIFIQNDDDWLYSFDSICETLGLNPGHVRKGLLHWWYHGLRERDQARLRVNRSQHASATDIFDRDRQSPGSSRNGGPERIAASLFRNASNE